MSSTAIYHDEALEEPLFSEDHASRLSVPILEFHSNPAPVIHNDNKPTPDGLTYNIYEWLQGWAERNRYNDLDGKSTFLHGGKVDNVVWSVPGKSQHRDQYMEDVVQHYKIASFSRGWPTRYSLNNDNQKGGRPTYFDATQIGMEFFGRFKCPAA